MTAFSIPGFGGDGVSRVDQGEGEVRQRTIEIGDTVISLYNIGTMSLIDGRRSHGPAIVGAVVTIFGLGVVTSQVIVGLLLTGAGVALIVYSVTRKVDVFLSIGTSDGGQTHIVSKNRKFLESIRSFIRQKLDSPDEPLVASFNITSNHFESSGGGIAIGANANASGVASDFRAMRG
jgi:hypothetical protein